MLWKNCEGIMLFRNTMKLRNLYVSLRPSQCSDFVQYIASLTPLHLLQIVGSHFAPAQPRSPCLPLGTLSDLCARVKLRLRVPAMNTLLPPPKAVQAKPSRSRKRTSLITNYTTTHLHHTTTCSDTTSRYNTRRAFCKRQITAEVAPI